MPDPVIISAAVEGTVDEAVVQKLIAQVGGCPGTVYGKNGKQDLRQKLAGYNNAARYMPWLVLVDLDDDFACAPLLRQTWLAKPAPRLCFRIAVRQVEAWLMADAEALARYLGVSKGKIPTYPEALSDAKREMITLAQQSRRRDLRADMVPRQGSGRRVGPAYASRLVEFAKLHWRPNVAAQYADSLRRAIDCLQRLTAGGRS